MPDPTGQTEDRHSSLPPPALWGLFGHLALMGMLVELADATRLEKVFLWVILSSAAAMVSIDAVRTTGWLASLAANKETVRQNAIRRQRPNLIL